ncbi:MAG: acetyl-CoA C-acyltransferase [Sandaracinaceae bacterium]|nr:acetyl-CoA C-acyltransferase [Sandaracinaceae bacterium]
MLADVHIYDALRTPRGAAKPDGALHGLRPVDLLTQLFAAQRARGLEDALVDDLVLGCSSQVGDQGANVAQTALRYAGFGQHVPGVTLNRFCCSGLDALRYASAQVASGMSRAVLAGGVECMSRVGMFADQGAWFSDPHVAAQAQFVHMGVAADILATRNGITRADCDAFALRSQRLATASQARGALPSRIPVTDPATSSVLLAHDECVRPGTRAEKLAALPPAFAEVGASGGGDARARAAYGLAAIDHVHTLASSPAMCDAAALVLLGGPELASDLGRAPRARVRAFASLSSDPLVMLEGAPLALERACASAGCLPGDLGVVECNESFAATALLVQRRLGLREEQLNPNGGALALGHPLGATGALLVSSLLDELEARGEALGAIVIPAGGGIAMALVVERT